MIVPRSGPEFVADVGVQDRAIPAVLGGGEHELVDFAFLQGVDPRPHGYASSSCHQQTVIRLPRLFARREPG